MCLSERSCIRFTLRSVCWSLPLCRRCRSHLLSARRPSRLAITMSRLLFVVAVLIFRFLSRSSDLARHDGGALVGLQPTPLSMSLSVTTEGTCCYNSRSTDSTVRLESRVATPHYDYDYDFETIETYRIFTWRRYYY